MSNFKLTPAEARAEWVKALRSGEYEQCKGMLSNGSGMCCLGVCCDIFMREEGSGEWFTHEGTHDFHTGNSFNAGSLPGVVKEWAGLRNHGGEFGGEKSLAVLNDEGKPFSEIADIIESEPPGLLAEDTK